MPTKTKAQLVAEHKIVEAGLVREIAAESKSADALAKKNEELLARVDTLAQEFQRERTMREGAEAVVKTYEEVTSVLEGELEDVEEAAANEAAQHLGVIERLQRVQQQTFHMYVDTGEIAHSVVQYVQTLVVR